MRVTILSAALTCFATLAVAETAYVGASLGYSPTLGPVATADAQLPNIFGKGSLAALSYRTDQRGDGGTIRFDLGDVISLPASGALSLLVNAEKANWADSAFATESTDLTLRAKFPLGVNGGIVADAFLRRSAISNVTPDTSALIVAEEGTEDFAGLRLGWASDTRDDPLLPRSGWLSGTDLGLARGDAGGWSSFAAKGATYLPIGESGVASIAVEAGRIIGFGDFSPRITERAFMGGDRPRGFAANGIGPRDPLTGTALGGENYAGASFEYGYDIKQIGNFAARLSAFADAGAVWGLSATEVAPGVFADDSLYWRSSAGFGLALVGDTGRIDLSLGAPIIEQAGDIRQQFGLSFAFGF